ncbi:hypothetical protein ACHAWO_012525 [Cyclotella atomus]|uniref:DDE Tnp4 domain-containing protein n=1 Tax=Cyclotella atomus TaxID=382360 RepID=A0ABD3NSL2_9STRA
MVKLAPTSLSDVSTLTQLASTLQVDVKALHLVRISSDFCRSPSCNLPSCEGNNRYCILCSQTWFPVPSKSISRNSRGHGLYGPEYMRLYNGVLQKKACCCDMPLCEKIGYSHSGMFRLPADNTHRTQAINALGIQTLALRDDLHSNHRSHRLAPWHFHPNHLEMGEDGTWRFKKMPAYFDQENKKFAFPPPNASLPATPAPPSSQPQPIATPLPSSTARTANTSTARAPISGLKAQRLNFTASAPRARTKRNSPETQQIEELEDAARLIQLQLDEKVGELNACLEAQKQLKLTVEAMGSEMIQIKIENAKLKGEIASLTSRIEELEQNKSLLSYDELKEDRTAALFGISDTLVHDIVYAWANLLCKALGKLFPVPTRNQLLRAYPKSVIRKFGHANIFMLLDATESYAEMAGMKTVNSILYSAYKHNPTIKWLVGCDPIGIVWNDSISDGYPGSISDPIATWVSDILKQVPFACAVEVDKGFLIENVCALLGVIIIRPMKFLDNQKQQSKTDTALTQKIGKTRIPIEQKNGQMKRSTAFFDRRIRIDQIALADLIFRSSYLLTNFKLPFIQERDMA